MNKTGMCSRRVWYVISPIFWLFSGEVNQHTKPILCFQIQNNCNTTGCKAFRSSFEESTSCCININKTSTWSLGIEMFAPFLHFQASVHLCLGFPLIIVTIFQPVCIFAWVASLLGVPFNYCNHFQVSLHLHFGSPLIIVAKTSVVFKRVLNFLLPGALAKVWRQSVTEPFCPPS